ncbi:MAG: methyltransferase [Nanoarchaeota archaeon]|nr:methyltransferase [Nanoarchaeota archaeon]
MEIYQPAEDSYLLSEVLTDYLSGKSKHIKILDMGSGSGIQAQTCKQLGFNNILTADINKEAIKNLKKQGFKSIHSDLFSNINKKEKFDLIIFNPPYLPEHKYDKEKDTTGGKKGFETILAFLQQAKPFLNKEGAILLLFSSFSQPKIIIEKAESLGYKTKELSSKKLFFEELFVFVLYK